MAEKKTIELEVKSNVGESISDLKALKRQLKDTAAGSEEFKKIFNQIDDLEDKIKSSKKASSDWIDTLENAGGPLGMVGASLNKAKVATQSFGGALKATGIGLFVSLIGGLVAAFQDNENAMKKLQPLLDGIGKIFNGVFRAVEPLFNTLVDLAISALPMVSNAFGVVYASVTAVFQSLGSLGSAVLKLIKGDFSGAWKEAKSSVNDFSKNYDDSISRFIAGTKEVTKVEKKEGQTRVTNKKETNDELDKLNEQRLADEMQSAKDAIAILEELKPKETPAEKEYREYQEKKAVLEANNLETEELTKQFLINQANAVEAARKEELNKEKELSDKKLAIKYKALDDLQIIFGAESKIGRMALLAKQALMARELVMEVAKTITFSAQAAARSTVALAEGTAQTAKVGFPQNIPLLIGFAAQAAGIYSAIKGALSSAKASGISTPNISLGSSASTSTSITSPNFNVVGASATNQLAQTIGNQQQQPIKTYVLANDVTTAQGLERNIIQSASIG